MRRHVFFQFQTCIAIIWHYYKSPFLFISVCDMIIDYMVLITTHCLFQALCDCRPIVRCNYSIYSHSVNGGPRWDEIRRRQIKLSRARNAAECWSVILSTEIRRPNCSGPTNDNSWRCVALNTVHVVKLNYCVSCASCIHDGAYTKTRLIFTAGTVFRFILTSEVANLWRKVGTSELLLYKKRVLEVWWWGVLCRLLRYLQTT